MNERVLGFTFGLALGLLLGWGLAHAHPPEFFEALSSYGWGNSSEWLRVVCVNRSDCWT